VSIVTDMTSDLAGMFSADEFGLSATYRQSANAAQVSCLAILEEDTAGGLIDIGQARSATLRLQASEIADPVIGGLVEITATGQTWQVDSLPSLEAGVWSMHAVTDRRPRA